MTKARVLRSPVIGKPPRGVLKWGRGTLGPGLPYLIRYADLVIELLE